MDFIWVIVILINKIIEAAHKDRIFAICPGLDIILFVVEQYRCGATKNHGIFATCFKSDFPFTFPRIPIVCPQVTVQADDIFRRSFRAIIFCRDIINVDAPTGINLQIIFSILQLFHDNDIVVINTIGDFDETVVGSCAVFIFRNCRFLTVIIERKVSISQRFILIFCDFLIFGIIVFPIFFSCFLGPGGGVVYIALVMAEGNCTFLIGRSLIADSRAIIYCDGRFVASC